MFSRTVISRAVSPFALFLSQQRGKKLNIIGRPVGGAGKALGRAYRAMSAGQKKALLAKAKAMKKLPAASKAHRARKVKHQLFKQATQLSANTDKGASINAYKKFVSANPKCDLAALVKKWKATAAKEAAQAAKKAAKEAAKKAAKQ